MSVSGSNGLLYGHKQVPRANSSLDAVSIWLGDNHAFTHGQLYAALSRVSSLKKQKIASNNENKLT